MSNHYFSNNPDLEHQISEWPFQLRGRTFHFFTDSGVFSKKTVDYGSRVLIDTFDWHDLPVGKILDIGCGYGPIGLSLAAVSGREVEMTDINERAVELARRNAKNNQIDHVDIHLSNIYEQLHDCFYAAIVSNPPIRAGKKVVHEILSGAAARLLPQGSLTVVIQKKQGAPSAQRKMAEVFGNVEVVAKDKGYYILRSIKETA